MPETIFISYRSLDSAKVDALVSRLSDLKNPDGTPRYRVWQDKKRDGDGIPPGADWWESIVNAIIQCRVFIFMMSAESVKNENCRAELRYAYARNRHILPIVLNGEFFYNASGKEDVRYMKDVSQELQDLRAQFLFDNGQQAYNQLEAKLADWMANPRPDTNAPYPKDPSQDDNNDYVLLYDEACDFAWRLEFEKAERKFRLLTRRTGHGFDHEAYQWLDILVKYKDIIRCHEMRSARHKVPQMWREYTQSYTGQEFLKVFNDEGLFDPENFKAIYTGGAQPQTPPTNMPVPSLIIPSGRQSQSIITPVDGQKPLNQAIDLIEKGKSKQSAYLLKEAIQILQGLISDGYISDVYDLKSLLAEAILAHDKIISPFPPIPTFLPQPFDWITIPAGKVTLTDRGGYLKENTTFDVPTFQMAKYPVTNAQFDVFINHPDGYKNPAWWDFSQDAKKWRAGRPQMDKSGFDGGDCPRETVSWYDSVAFCLWLSAMTDEKIMLPTEQQW